MRLLTMLGLIVLAVSLRPARAAGQQAPPVPKADLQAAAVIEVRIDPRLLVAAGDGGAALARAEQRRVDLDEPQWNLSDMVDYMAWGMVPGFVIGSLVGGANSGGGLEGMAGVLIGGMAGLGAGAAAGGVVYTLLTL